MVVHLFVIFAVDLVGPQLDVGDFAGTGVDRCKSLAGEPALRLGRVDDLSTCRSVDGERIWSGVYLTHRPFAQEIAKVLGLRDHPSVANMGS